MQHGIHARRLIAAGLWVLSAAMGCTAGSNRSDAESAAVQTASEDTIRYLPYPRDMAGSYRIAAASLQALQLPAPARGKTVFNLRADSTFQLNFFPLHAAEEENITRYELVNATGRWEVEKSTDGPNWYVLMQFDTIARAATGRVLATNVSKSNIFRIQDSVPPHTIHIPLFTNPAENKAGVLLEKK